MQAFICAACATQFEETDVAPAKCPICLDERQFVPPAGQSWTTLDALRKRHANQFRTHEPGLIGIGTVPQFCIGQRALLVRTPDGNFLWDCIALIDDATIEIVKALGGLRGIAISHPHYYTTMVEWSRAFGNVPIHLHKDDSRWIMRPDSCIKMWDGETLGIAEGLTLIRAGGHFKGGTVAHWAYGCHGRGALLSGDIVMTIPDSNYVSFMRSYPNLIPLPAKSVRRIGAVLEPYSFEAIYGPFFERNVPKDGHGAVQRSVTRYINAIERDLPAE
jgi:hypothetical protein